MAATKTKQQQQKASSTPRKRRVASQKQSSLAPHKHAKNVLNFFGLKWYVRFASVIMALSAVMVLELADSYAVALTQSFSKRVQSPEVTTIPLVSVNLTTWLAFLLLVSAASYFVVSTTGFGWYIKNLKHNVNYMRWLHHALSTTLMVMIVAMLSGVSDVLSLLLIAVVSIAVAMFGLAMEVYNERKRSIRWHAYSAGLLLGLAGWTALLLVFAGVRLNTSETLPQSLLNIYIVLSIFFIISALNMIMQYSKQGPWQDYIFGEKIYIGINVIAKCVFAWLVATEFLLV